jgi:2-polyprenyl-3-methyl-5-hydroxy-6-metoxy-1,4-benzoquinol methylase
MKQTPANNIHNQNVLDILALSHYKKVVEIGCMHGALAKEYRKIINDVTWYGIDIDKSYAEEAEKHCTKTFSTNVEKLSELEMTLLSDANVWIFADVLEHLFDPWSLLKKISSSNSEVEIIACIPNSQHWSLQVSLNSGNFIYQDSGLLDRTHVRFFTLKTMLAMFESSGYEVLKIIPRIFDFPNQNAYDECIFKMAELSGVDPKEALNNSKVYQYVFHVKSKQ